MGLVLYKTAERPSIKLWLQDDDGSLINFSTGYTFEFKIGKPGSAAVVTKTTGITGAAGSGNETSGTPNLTIAFAAGDLDALVPGAFGTKGQIKATQTAGTLDRIFSFDIEIRDVVT